MVKKIKKVLSVCVVAATILAGSVNVAWAEYAPSNYSFSFWGEYGDEYSYSSRQGKDNDSYSRVDYYNGDYPVEYTVVGYDGSIREDIQTEPYVIYPGNSNDKMTNWVVENGMCAAVLRGRAIDDPLFYADGVWFPDTRE